MFFSGVTEQTLGCPFERAKFTISPVEGDNSGLKANVTESVFGRLLTLDGQKTGSF